MEAPAVFAFAAFYLTGDHALETVPLVLLALWQMHYVHRALIFPFRIRASGKRVPVLVPGLAIGFNMLNAYVNARWVSHLGSYPDSWLADPRMLAGAGLFVVGYVINLHADTVLIGLRKPGETGYAIPRGGMYRWVTSANYFGELLEWIGWAVATWSLAGVAFAVYTAANLVPRALTTHRWYLERFDDYPPERKAVIPFVL
jgi:protein-S-isoprenylcysteine O-methyltransferase Ste14